MTLAPRIELTADGPSLSRIAVGNYRLLPLLQRDGVAAATRLIAAAADLGMTTFDSADIYGRYEVEAAFGEALQHRGGRRDSFEIVTKCGIMLKGPARPAHRVKHYDSSAGHISQSLDMSLRNLRTDYIDVLLLHRPDPLMDADATADALVRAVNSGKVRAVGVSNFTPSQLDLLASRLPFPIATNQIEMSVLCTDPLFDGRFDHAQQHRYAPMIWGPLGGGALFTGEGERERRVREALTAVAGEIGAGDVATMALSWLLTHPARLLPVLGTTDPARLPPMARALDLAMDRQQWFSVLEASAGRPVA